MSYIIAFIMCYLIYMLLDQIFVFDFTHLPVGLFATYFLVTNWFALTMPHRLLLGLLLGMIIGSLLNEIVSTIEDIEKKKELMKMIESSSSSNVDVDVSYSIDELIEKLEHEINKLDND